MRTTVGQSGFFRASAVRRVACLAVLLLCATTGCLNNRCELVEAELRDKERQLDEMRASQGKKDSDIQALEVELEQLQRKLLCTPRPQGTASGAVVVVNSMTLGRLTGGYRRDPAATADDALQVLLEPRDADNSVVKAPGAVHIELFEVTLNGIKVPLSQWDLSARELRRMWDTPLFGGAGYRIELPWKAPPTTEKLRVVVRFTTLDGQVFEADKEFDVRLPEPVRRPRRDGPAFTPDMMDMPLPPGMPPPAPDFCPPKPVYPQQKPLLISPETLPTPGPAARPPEASSLWQSPSPYQRNEPVVIPPVVYPTTRQAAPPPPKKDGGWLSSWWPFKSRGS